MNLVKLIWGEVVGLFVDDGFLAIAILVVVGGAAVLAFGFRTSGELVGAVLVLGCIGVLVGSAVRGLRRG